MSLPIEFTQAARDRSNDETIATDPSVHETLRKAISACNGEDSITLSLEAAMDLILEWDKRGYV
jgi:hypothetical protein